MATFKATYLHMHRGNHTAVAILHRYDDRVVIYEINRTSMSALRSEETFPSESAAFAAAQEMWVATLPVASSAYRAVYR